MSRMILYRPLPILAAQVNGAPLSFSGGENLLTPEPKEVLTFVNGTGATHVDILLGPGVTFDSVFVGYQVRSHPLPPEFTWQGGDINYDDFTFGVVPIAPSSSPRPLRRHSFHRLAAPVTRQGVRLAYGPSVPNGHSLAIGIVAVGLAIETSFNRERGGGRPIYDTGSREARPDGGFGIHRGARKSGFRWTWGDLDDAEIERLHDLGMQTGSTAPIVVVEDPDPTVGLNERVHYGLFDGFEPYERRDPSKHRWSLSMTQWV